MPGAEIIKKKKKVGSGADQLHSLTEGFSHCQNFERVFSSAAALRFSCRLMCDRCIRKRVLFGLFGFFHIAPGLEPCSADVFQLVFKWGVQMAELEEVV